MIYETTRTIYQSISQDQLKSTLEKICTYHRIQASPGYHDAAVFCQSRLEECNIQSQILSYPAQSGVFFQTAPSIDAWCCHDAWCVLDETGERICDFRENPISLIQRSAPWMNSSSPIEIVEIDSGNEESAYDGIDFNGKLVLVHDEYPCVREWAIKKRGAIGYITDYVCPEPDVTSPEEYQDIRKYTSFWWRPNQKRVFGFVITRRQGEMLHQICQRYKKKGQYPTVHCLVDSELSSGSLEIVTGVLPGISDTEVLLVAHLCHPRCCANDNASGATAVIEALCTLKKQLDDGTLNPLHKTIRILLVPEIMGSYSYLNGLTDSQRSKIIAAFTVDMAGGRQGTGYGPLTIYETPHCSPSAANSIAGSILKELRRDTSALNVTDKLPLFNSSVSEFIEGSDHGVYNDPACGIPCPLLTQWPDKYYHTDHDTPDVIDYFLLRHSCSLAASFAYHAANLDMEDVPTLLAYLYQRMTENLNSLIDDEAKSSIEPSLYSHMAQNYLVYYQNSCRDILHYLPLSQQTILNPMIENAIQHLERGATELFAITGCNVSFHPSPLDLSTMRNGDHIPVRHFFGRLDYGFDWYTDVPEATSALAAYHKSCMEYDLQDFENHVIFYIDGKRSLAEIAEKVLLDFRGTRKDANAIADYADLLYAYHLIEWK